MTNSFENATGVGKKAKNNVIRASIQECVQSTHKYKAVTGKGIRGDLRDERGQALLSTTINVYYKEGPRLDGIGETNSRKMPGSVA